MPPLNLRPSDVSFYDAHLEEHMAAVRAGEYGGHHSPMQKARTRPAGPSAQALRSATKDALHTTVVGVGVDLSVGTVERLAALPGGKYVGEVGRCDSARLAHDGGHFFAQVRRAGAR